MQWKGLEQTAEVQVVIQVFFFLACVICFLICKTATILIPPHRGGVMTKRGNVSEKCFVSRKSDTDVSCSHYSFKTSYRVSPVYTGFGAVKAWDRLGACLSRSSRMPCKWKAIIRRVDYYNQKDLVDIPDSKGDLKSILPVPCPGIQLLWLVIDRQEIWSQSWCSGCRVKTSWQRRARPTA